MHFSMQWIKISPRCVRKWNNWLKHHLWLSSLNHPLQEWSFDHRAKWKVNWIVMVPTADVNSGTSFWPSCSLLFSRHLFISISIWNILQNCSNTIPNDWSLSLSLVLLHLVNRLKCFFLFISVSLWIAVRTTNLYDRRNTLSIIPMSSFSSMQTWTFEAVLLHARFPYFDK